MSIPTYVSDDRQPEPRKDRGSMRNLIPAAVLAATILALSGCGRGPAGAPAVVLDPSVARTLDAVFDAPSGGGAPVPIPALRATIRPGDRIVTEGRIMGVLTPFVGNRAAFVLGDPGTLTPCNERHADGCKTPWDLCCDDPAAIRAGTATVQIVGPGGDVLRTGLKGVRGLRELSRVRVEGVAARTASSEALIIDARSIVILP